MKSLRLAALFAGSLLASLIGAHCRAQGVVPDVIEFYNPDLDHYFITANAIEAAAIDSGSAGAAWTRTGNTFKAGGTTSVCRFYGSQSPGPNSHFYTADADECASLKGLQATTPATQKRWNFESLDFQVSVPVNGVCAAGTVAVYRAYNNGFTRGIDSNHRITTNLAAIAEVVARGWRNEGIVMCAGGSTTGSTGSIGMSISPVNVLLVPGESRDVYATVTPRNGFNGTAAIAIDGAPAGVAAQLASNSVATGADGGTVVVHLTASAGAAPSSTGVVSVVARATDGSLAQAALQVGVAAAGDPVARRLGTIAAVEEQSRVLSRQGLSGLSFVQAIAAFMATQPMYVKTGVDVETLSAWGRFADGRIHVVADNRNPAPAATSADTKSTSLKTSAEVPSSTQARLMHTFGVNFEGQVPIEEMRASLASRGWNIRSGPEGQGTVEMLKTIGGDGFFYINTHGSRAEIDDPSEPESKIYSIQTSTLVSSDNENTYSADLAAIRLVHFTARNGDRLRIAGIDITGDWDTRYAITYRFVDAYMRFAKGSVAFINACFSGRNESFVNAFIRQGAGVYLGWSALLNSAVAYKAAPYFVDRMLGANRNADKESPAQRPFAYDLVLADMAKKGLDFDTQSGAKLAATVKTGLPYPPILAPSIRNLRVDEVPEQLTLAGEFGDGPGKVTIGGTAVTPKSWSPTEIVVPLPRTGAGSSGDVVVEVRGVHSNARPLTEWAIPLHYLWSNALSTSGFTFEGTGNIRFRADIGGYRTAPGEALKYIPRGGNPTRDSFLPVTGSGTHTDGSCTQTLSGFANFISPAALDGALLPVLTTGFAFDGNAKKGAIGMAFGYQTPPHRITVTGQGCNGSGPAPVTMLLLDGTQTVYFDQSDTPGAVSLPGFSFALDAQYGIPPLNRSYPGAGTITVSWPAVPAKSPPRDAEDAGK